MKTIINSRIEAKTVDKKGAIQSIEELGSQIQQLWEQSRSIEFDSSYKNAKRVVVAGMGGSAYGTHIITTLFKDQLKIPVIVIPDYTLPTYVDAETVVILSSYSGTSEETLSAAHDALNKGAHITGLTTGGLLANLLQEHQVPCLLFDPTFNACGVPRFAYGYSIFGQMVLFERLGLISITSDDVTSILSTIAEGHTEWSMNISSDTNTAKLTAFECIDHIPVFVAAEHLEGVAHVIANALNENSKSFSEYRVIPEMNHHLLEGLQFPTQNDTNLWFLIAFSSSYQKANQRRCSVTLESIERHHLEVKKFQLSSKTNIEQVFEFLLFGIYVSYYLALLYGQDPALTPEVEWFKSELQK